MECSQTHLSLTKLDAVQHTHSRWLTCFHMANSNIEFMTKSHLVINARC